LKINEISRALTKLNPEIQRNLITLYKKYPFRIGSILPVILFFCVIFLHFEASAGKGEDIIQRVQKKFEELKSLSAHFEVSYEVGGSDQVHHEAGSLFMDDEGRFRTETSQQIVVSDGVTLWMYDLIEKQVIVRNLTDGSEDIITPQRLLYDYPDNYSIDKIENTNYAGLECKLLSMLPKQETDPTRKLLVWIDKAEHLTRKFLIEDLADNITTFEFEAFELGGTLPSGTFQFTPPDSAEIIDIRDK